MKKKDANDPVKKHVTYAYRISMIRDKAIQYEGTISNADLGADLVYKTISSCGQDDREQLISGTHPECWTKLFGEDDE